jgi:hypothetical protein
MKHYFGMDFYEDSDVKDMDYIPEETIGYSIANTYADNALCDVMQYWQDVEEIANNEVDYPVDRRLLSKAIDLLGQAADLLMDECWN